jgi:hypothetical protein
MVISPTVYVAVKTTHDGDDPVRAFESELAAMAWVSAYYGSYYASIGVDGPDQAASLGKLPPFVMSYVEIPFNNGADTPEAE